MTTKTALKLHENEATVRLAARGPGETTEQLSSKPGALLVSVFVDDIDPGASLTVELFDASTGQDEGEALPLPSPDPITAPGVYRMIVPVTHGKAFAVTTIAGGDVTYGLYVSVLSGTPFCDPEGNHYTGLNPVPVTLIEPGAAVQVVLPDTSAALGKDASETIDFIVAAGVRARDVQLACSAFGSFEFDIGTWSGVAYTRAMMLRTAPAAPNVPLTNIPIDLLGNGTRAIRVIVTNRGSVANTADFTLTYGEF